MNGILFCMLLITSSLTVSAEMLAEPVGQPPRPKSFGDSGPYTFDYLLGENSNFDTEALVLFVDYDLPKNIITNLLNAGKRVICYVNIGAWEEWRSDASAFPESVLGNDYEGWPGERWLDVRNLNILLPIMRARFRAAASKGCEGVDPDNMNGWSVDTGFPISFDDQLVYNEAMAKEIRSAGMMAGLKNDNEQAWELEPFNDFVVAESCARYDECGNFEAFIWKNKPVFAIEYTDLWDESEFDHEVCWLMQDTGISFILKDLDLHNDFILPCIWPRQIENRKVITRRSDFKQSSRKYRTRKLKSNIRKMRPRIGRDRNVKKTKENN